MKRRSKSRIISKRSAMLEAAVSYAKDGLPIFPCTPGDKNPLTPHGFKDSSTEAPQIRRWWTQWPDANIGIATGKTSGLLVLDVDPRNGGFESLEALFPPGKRPRTAMQITGGGGLHIFFEHPGRMRGIKLAPGIDVKADGGYIIASPSVHPSGKRYRWVEGRSLADLQPAKVPDWLLSEMNSRGRRSTTATTTDSEVWSVGERNNRLTSLAGTMRWRGMSQEAIEAALLEENQQRCDPPLDEGEVQRIAASVSRYELGNPPTSAPSGWPSPLKEDAFHGVAGELVRIIEPHSEADPAALLIQCLVAAGNVSATPPMCTE